MMVIVYIYKSVSIYVKHTPQSVGCWLFYSFYSFLGVAQNPELNASTVLDCSAEDLNARSPIGPQCHRPHGFLISVIKNREDNEIYWVFIVLSLNEIYGLVILSMGDGMGLSERGMFLKFYHMKIKVAMSTWGFKSCMILYSLVSFTQNNIRVSFLNSPGLKTGHKWDSKSIKTSISMGFSLINHPFFG